ncbi:MAG: DUF192 domain-containing protein [Sphingomonadales bacterium]|nr:DUF192 domain-containing protein [Sphingomonadales bacterium]
MRVRQTWRAKAFIALALALAACSTKPAESAAKAAETQAPARHPESGLPVIPLTVTHGSARHAFRVEVARDSVEQARGLMFRTRMGADEGMIFPMDPPRDAAFWMKNTVIPLDIVFIGADRRILNIAANAVPYSETPLPSAGKVSGVLELNGGRAAALGIGPGDRVDW